MSRSDFRACVVASTRDVYVIRSELCRLDFHPYIVQSWRPWRIPDDSERTKLCPVFNKVLLLPECEASSPILRDIGLIEVLSLRIPPAVISQFLLREVQRGFDHAGRSTHERQQARADRKVTLRLPHQQFTRVPSEPDVVIERFIGRLSAAAPRTATAAVHVGA
jgi:hypothetical protein